MPDSAWRFGAASSSSPSATELGRRLPVAAGPGHVEDPVRHLAHVRRPSEKDSSIIAGMISFVGATRFFRRNAEQRRVIPNFLRFEAAPIVYPPIVLVFLAIGDASPPHVEHGASLIRSPQSRPSFCT